MVMTVFLGFNLPISIELPLGLEDYAIPEVPLGIIDQF
jgi:hypothetical protein